MGFDFSLQSSLTAFFPLPFPPRGGGGEEEHLGVKEKQDGLASGEKKQRAAMAMAKPNQIGRAHV